MRTKEVSVLLRGLRHGANYIDTARVYMGGQNEKIVGEALKGYRDKVYVATKVVPGNPDTMRRSIAASLEALDLERVELLQLHDVSNKQKVMEPKYREVLAEAKRQHQTRFVGITCHKNEAEVLNAVADDPDKFYDVVLVTYNFNSKPEVKDAIGRVAKSGVGVIAMKTQGGGYRAKTNAKTPPGGRRTKASVSLRPHQALLKFVLQNPDVTAAIPAMVDLNQVREDMAVMNKKLTPADLDLLKAYQVATAGFYCHRCGACTGSCRAGLDIAHINRCLMYADGYGDRELALATYAELAPEMTAQACAGCSQCTARCANGLNVAERMQRARHVFA